jgi:hypothetical protein
MSELSDNVLQCMISDADIGSMQVDVTGCLAASNLQTGSSAGPLATSSQACTCATDTPSLPFEERYRTTVKYSSRQLSFNR